MTTKLNILLLFVFAGCSRNVDELNGQYIAVNDLTGDGYATIDIQDSIVQLNKNSVFYDERDTIIINPRNNTFIRSNRRPFPIYEFRAVDDTIYISYAYDAGEETVKYVKKEVPPMFNYFAESGIDIQLRQYNSEIITQLDQSKILNLVVGRLKEDLRWPDVDPDSVLIEFERFDYLRINELPQLTEYIQEVNDLTICLHFDERVPKEISIDIRTRLQKSRMT